MKFKLDENLPVEAADILKQAGYDTETVFSENLVGTSDPNLAEHCQREERILLTLDMDFADIRAYPPKECPGLIVLRLARQDKLHILNIFERIAKLVGEEKPASKLWIVEESLVRIRE